MLEFTRLKNNLTKPTDGFASVRLALLCDYSSQHLALAIRGSGVDVGLRINVFESDYDQIEQTILDGESALYAFNPEVVLLSKSSYRLLDSFYATPLHRRSEFAETVCEDLRTLLAALRKKTAAPVILTNFVELNDAVFGTYAANVNASFLYQVRRLNLLLMEEAQKGEGLFVADVQSAVLAEGLAKSVDQKHLLRADLPWSLEFLAVLGRTVIGLVQALNGKGKKCLVLDLDNTLWGGVIGDDGLEGIQLGDLGIGKAFVRLQKWVKELKRRGIIICVCSKNTETIAKEVFQKHPDTVLRLEDFAVFVANWNNKVDNLHFIRNTLNIGFEAMVFVDDNPFERGMVKDALPQLAVPDLPEDPADYLPILQSLNLFETTSFTAEDEQRTALYQQEAERSLVQQAYKNEDEYLQSLAMVAEVQPLDAFTIPRAAQLSQRSNQFNLRTIRYTEAELAQLAVSPRHHGFVVSLHDKFGTYGIVVFVVLQKRGDELFIENWMMSCRVLKRGVEALTLNAIVRHAAEGGLDCVVGEYLPTAKNGLVKDLYQQLGFRAEGGLWVLDVANFARRKTHIETRHPEASLLTDQPTNE